MAFRVSLDLLSCLQALEASEGETSANNPEANDRDLAFDVKQRMSMEGVELEAHNHERKLHFKQQMVVEFSNNTMQVRSLTHWPLRNWDDIFDK